MASSPPRFPAEISFLIIDQLAQANDKRALLFYSLVYRSWLPVARAGLFKSIKVVTAANGRLDAFANFLARCRDVCPLIHDLTLSCDPAARLQDRKVPERLSWPHFRTMVYMLPRLRSLTLEGIFILSDSLNARRLSSDAFARPTLRSLRMSGCELHNVDMTDALDLLRIFSEVGNLSFEGSWSMAHTRPFLSISTRTTTIRHVHFDALGAQATQMLCRFIGAPRGDQLRSVHLTWHSWAEVEAYQSFLGGCAQNLKHLELEPTYKFWTCRLSKFSLWSAFSDTLAKCAHLESLCLHAQCGYLSFTPGSARCLLTSLDVYEAFLTHGPPPTLRRFTLKIPICSKANNSGGRGWSAMFRAGEALTPFDSALAAVQSLTSVVLELQVHEPLVLGASGEEESTLLIHSALPKIHAKGLLRVDFTSVICREFWQRS
ncbi:hypothetical protein C8Q70DRAFT_531014 [Cubamyces menziesii]|uniref:Uncharacterized protein n=1 Tax=Trametes cubensis TaxID=1111947 RepID=A0AAD7X3N9_9APHY|nr:hypothetical protein C8Q70DRAFT_531014 [Cubamyces menziesii]KAJ8456290.1 hypothetical protein ONZ51_g12213 [Trametes cubensis]